MGNSNPNGTTALKRDGFELEDTFTVSARERGLMDRMFSRKAGAAKR
jgi:hypothetical protein